MNFTKFFKNLKLVGQLSNCGEQLNYSSPNPEEKPLIMAENELLGAASSIEAVSNKLSQMRPRQINVNLKI